MWLTWSPWTGCWSGWVLLVLLPRRFTVFLRSSPDKYLHIACMNNVSYFTITSFKLLFDSGKLNTTRLHPIASLSLTFLSPQRLVSVGQSFHQTAALPGIVVCERFRLFLVLLELSLNITFFVPTRGKLMFQAIDSGTLIYHLMAQIQSIKPPWVLCQFLFPRSVLSSGQWTNSSQNFAAPPYIFYSISETCFWHFDMKL